ncbi:MAG TPA: lyase family protein, partial [Acidimicrobiia bacterium]|nr:lyase family protein [Acidimicrobiia bacterium]
APAESAQRVADACSAPVTDPEAVLAGAWSEGTPLIPLLAEIRARVSEDDARWLHHGATTQDVVDTAAMIQVDQALGILDAALVALARLLARLTIEHRDQPQMGRTFLQHARVSTFGFRTATWLDPVLRHLGELRESRAELVVQLGGPVGDLAPYGERGIEVMEALASHLGLGSPGIAWHSDRSRVAALVASLQRCAGTMARIGADVALLASGDIAEVRARPGASSSMTGKQNPIDAIRAVAAAEACTGAASMIVAARSPELDRGVGGWHVEWLALPLVFETTAASVEAMTTCLRSLQVDSVQMTSRAGAAPVLDPRLIDRVVADFEEMIG